jgi:pimeloyl-ACP methyl ester carboxylesterase
VDPGLGELDRVIPSAWTDHLGETFVDREPSLLPGMGHFVQLEAPQRAIGTIHRALSLAQRERRG